MKLFPCLSRAGWRNATGLASFVLSGTMALPGNSAETFQFHHENILGTSLDLQIAADDESRAEVAEKAALAEIERLRLILSSYDPTSELSRLNATHNPMACSQEMIDVLSAYDQWQLKSAGAYSGHIGGLAGLWKNAERVGVPPSAESLQAAVKSLAAPGWKIDADGKTVTRVCDAGTLDVNSLGKGYITTRAAMAAGKACPDLTGILVNIGGDIYASGHPADGGYWKIGVADPARSADNAMPMTEVKLSDQSISTSAAYERGFTVAGKRSSHILDPRTGMPAEAVAGATVIAKDNTTSNALATTLCVLTPEQGIALVKSTPGTECLIVGSDGREWRSNGFSSMEAGPRLMLVATGAADGANTWPAGHQVAIEIDLKEPAAGGRRKPKRPFVAVWVEDGAGKRVRTVTVWGKERKYWKELRKWWSEAKSDPDWAATVTRATRNAGKHRIEWDGKDDKGNPLPPGTYTIALEVNREHGAYCIQKGTIICGKDAATGTIAAATEFGEAKLSYGPAGK